MALDNEKSATFLLPIRDLTSKLHIIGAVVAET